jgi:hypothetical protein
VKLEGDKAPDLVVGQAQRLQHGLLGDLAGPRLDHGDGVVGPGHDQVELGVDELLQGWIEDELAVHHAHADTADRPCMGDVADLQGQRGAGDGKRRRVLLLVRGDDGGDELDVVAEVLREKRPHRPVDHAAGENGRLGRPALTARKAAGDATRGI